MTDPAVIETAERALYPYSGPPATETRLLEVHAAAHAVLTAITPLIRAQVLEEAAKVADGEYRLQISLTEPTAAFTAEAIAAAIRALKT